MRSFRGVIGWLPLVLLTACVASHPEAPMAVRLAADQPGAVRPAVDRLLTQGQLQVAEAHLHDFGFDPGPVDGLYTPQTRAIVRAFQARYGLPATGLLNYTTRLQLIPGLDYDKPDR